MARFGDDTAGGDTFPCSGDRALLSLFTLTEAGDLSEIIARFDASSTAGASIKGLVYANSSGTPGARLAVGAAVAVPAGGGLVSSAISVSLAAGDYWLGYVANSFQAVAQCDAAGGLSRMEGATYASPAATWTQAGTSAAQLNVYAEYTAAAAEPLLLLRKFPLQGPRAGETTWADESPASALAQFEFWGPEEVGPPTYSRTGRATARPALAASRLTTAIRAGLVRQRAEVSASRTVTAARGAIARARAEVSVARTAVIARVARAAAVTRAAAVAVVQTLSTYSRAARGAARTAARAARTAVIARAAAAPARARAATARAVTFLRLTRAAARARAAATRLLALARPAAARARAQARADRAVVMQRATRATAGARIRAAVEKIVGLPLTRPGRLFMWQPTAFAPALATALAPAKAVRWSDRRAVAFRPLPIEQWVARE